VTARRKPAPPREWWATYFDAQYLKEYEPLLSERDSRRQVGRLLEVLALPIGVRVLDVPCGQGRHARLLAEAGYRVDALDYSADLLRVARAEGAPAGSGTVRYHRGDMRELPERWTGRFQAVVNLFTSFGFFRHPADDARVVREFARVLAPGGTFVWHGGSRDGVMARFIARDWWTTSDGTLVAHERRFDPLSGILTVDASWRGPAGPGARSYRLRLYTATRLAELLADSGLVVEEAYSGWSDRPLTRRAGEMVLVARKRELPRIPSRR
jgi:SAM-dependent methyltransferase